MDAVAITDHGVMYGAVEFYKACLEQGVKPIIGCEVYVAPRSRMQKEPGIDDKNYHLTLLAEDNEGLENLTALCSTAFLDGFYYRPRVDREVLAERSGGIIALSGCLSGELATIAARDGLPEARRVARELASIFKPGSFYIEMQRNETEGQEEVNKVLRDLAAAESLPIVATNDVHYLRAEDQPVHDVLLCIQTGKRLDDPTRLRFGTNQVYMRSPEEMRDRFRDIPEAISATVEIADRCSVKMRFGQPHVPRFPVSGTTEGEYLRRLAFEGAARRYGRVSAEISQRLEYELSVIEQMGYSGYFLVVWDFIRFAREKGIFIGPGRGSAPASLVAYCIGITAVDPIKYGLIFERFLNPERVSMPDIDTDICYERRDELIAYVRRTYGEDRVAQIITFGTMAAKAAIRDVARVVSLTMQDTDRILRALPQGLGITIDSSLEQSEELRALYDSDSTVRRVIDTARAIEGMPRHASIHAAGIVIGDRPLSESVPLCRTSEEGVATQYSMEWLEELGLLKMDFLANRNLTVVGKTVQAVRESVDPTFDLESIPLDDGDVYEDLGRGMSVGVFQFESRLYRGLLRDVLPTTFEDLIAISALGRPGPIAYIPDFVARKHGRQPISYAHPRIEKILRPTYGIMLYQEQVMQVAAELAGFTMGQADLLRRAMGKKKPELLIAQKASFIEGCRARGVGDDVAAEVFSQMMQFSGYGFCRAHSAAYALLSYQMAYLKHHYPVQFMSSLLSSVMTDTRKMSQYMTECRRMGIAVLPPDINESSDVFAPGGDGRSIRFPLSGIKGIGRAAASDLVSERMRGGPFTSLADLCDRGSGVRLQKRAIEALIRCGATDSFGFRRSQLLAVLDQAFEIGVSRRAEKENGQISLIDSAFEDMTNRDHLAVPDLPELPADQILAAEKELLGMRLSDSGIGGFEMLAEEVGRYSVDDIVEMAESGETDIGAPVLLCGVVESAQLMLTKKQQEMAVFELECRGMAIECVAFPSVYTSRQSLIRQGSQLLVSGKLDERNGRLQVKVDGVEAVPPRFAGLVVDRSHRHDSVLQSLHMALVHHRGTVPVFLKIDSEQGAALLALGDEYSVASSESALEEFRRVLGRANVIVQQ